MTKPQAVLLQLLHNANSTTDEALTSVRRADLNSHELAHLFFDTAFLITGIQFLKDEFWLLTAGTGLTPAVFKNFVQRAFVAELYMLSYLLGFFETYPMQNTLALTKKCESLQHATIELLKSRAMSEQKIFATQGLALMAQLYKQESAMQEEKKSQGQYLGISLYRTFDSLDEILHINYTADCDMPNNSSERIYAGAGAGVQSGYSTVLEALRHLKPLAGERFVDLGSGFGRVGLIVGLTRPDIQFLGYEYVQHRVDAANLASQAFGLSAHVQFFTQDLFAKNFSIPDAEIYYLYDPFTTETYKHVLQQLRDISLRQKIAVFTRGNARHWLTELAARNGWQQPIEFDDGNLCLFRSEHVQRTPA
jgi:hypothetical protein